MAQPSGLMLALLASLLFLLPTSVGAADPEADPEQRVAAQQQPDYWNGSAWTDPNRGFLWYAPPAAKPKPSKVLPPRKTLSAMTNKELGEEVKRLLDIAVQDQTQQSVREYLVVQQYAMDRASRFSDVFRRTVWTTPELDYSLRARPTNALAIASFDAKREEMRRNTAEALGQTHGLFFYFKADCAYCHQLAPILRMFQRNYGVEVFAISVDGGRLTEFPNARRDNGSAQNLGITTVPAVFLADKRSGKVQPVGYGVLSLEELVNRIHILTRTQPGEEY